MATKKDLQKTVDYFNNKYCKNSKNHLVISQAYGGYFVYLTGKRNKRTGKPLKNSVGTATDAVGPHKYHDTASKIIESLYEADSRGWIKNQVRFYDKRKYFK